MAAAFCRMALHFTGCGVSSQRTRCSTHARIRGSINSVNFFSPRSSTLTCPFRKSRSLCYNTTYIKYVLSAFLWGFSVEYASRMIYMDVLRLIIFFVRGIIADRTELAIENLALRQQLMVLRQSSKRPSLHLHDRIFWIWLSRMWKNWQNCLVLVQPETVIQWHRQGFRLYWRWKSKNKKLG